MKSPVWTVEQIHAYPESGNWWYGLVRDDDGLHVAEIFPGLGYVPTLPGLRDFKNWWWLLRDIWGAAR